MTAKHELRLTPTKALNPAYQKQKLGREQIDLFKKELIALLNQVEDDGLEEFVKNALSDFLKNTWYKGKHYINIKERKDLVIHHEDKPKSDVGVIIEAKAPKNKSEMVSQKNLNTKALQELLLYYLTERIGENNKSIKHLIVTNVNEWFVFDEIQFEKLFAQNKKLVEAYKAFNREKRSTDYFYKEIAQEYIAKVEDQLTYTYFDIRKYEKELRDSDKQNDRKLIALYKLLSPEHLLKLPFANDSNQLDRKFYSELLHIIGLSEEKDGGKKLIRRCEPNKRNESSLLEAAIIQLDARDKLNRLDNIRQYGENRQEQLFNVGLALSITWINRVLFLKLLEGQLLTYNKGNEQYKFLDFKHINNYDDLDELFFQVLAKTTNDRRQSILEKFAHIPYLNSSLFEPTELEQECLFISQLADDREMPIISSSVLKDEKGKTRKGNIVTIEYLFEFLSAYDFSSEGAEDIQEENKTLINASVLGLIFEKINGYKDGSFFTPGFITMYMCRETLRRSVVQKFNDAKGWECESIADIYNNINAKESAEANNIINSLKVCDPAVGSGHFLVSALNEFIAIKHDLGILQDANGKKLRDVEVAVVNDELIVKNEDGELYQYNPSNKESQRIQETLFKEKQTIIENCLFGVDINPNSVKICRLRLWIELLKNAYYKPNEVSVNISSGVVSIRELETLPNIDINIKCGNSLVSRFALDADLKKALKSIKYDINAYKGFVQSYKRATDKEEKRGFEKLIDQIKGDFRSEINKNDPKVRRLQRLSAELWTKYESGDLFETKLTAAEKRDKKKLETDIDKLTKEIEEIKSNKIYENAFEWRFEFPEVLNDKGDFVGFDAVIGNPPYVNFRDIKNINEKDWLQHHYTTSEYQSDLFILFIELAFKIQIFKGQFGFIIPNSLANNLMNSKIRKFLLTNSNLLSLVNTPIGVFPDATVDTMVILASKCRDEYNDIKVYYSSESELFYVGNRLQSEFAGNENYYFDFLTDNRTRKILTKIEKNTTLLSELTDSSSGIKEYETGKGTPKQTKLDREHKVFNSKTKETQFHKRHLSGKNIGLFQINWQDDFLKYGSWLAAPRSEKYFDGNRLIIREIPSKTRLISAATNEEYTVKNTAHIFIPAQKKVTAEYLCGIINSSLIGFYFINKFSERDDVFPKAKIGQCRSLPIKMAKESEIKEIEDLVNILSKSSNDEFETSIKKLDQLVYQLYGLTEEEIKIVEESVK